MARCATSGALPTDKGFTGQRADALTGLDYYNARSYDPVAGQFTSADTMLPKSVAQPDPSQLNRYTYVGGNPETRSDPSGHRYTTGHASEDQFGWVTPHNRLGNTYSDLKQNAWPGQSFEDFDPKPAYPKENTDGQVLFDYFGITDPETGRHVGPSLFKIPPNNKTKTPDYLVGYAVPGLDVESGIPGLPGVESRGLAAVTPIDLYTPAMTASPNKIRNEAVSKGKQAAIVAIDITGNTDLAGNLDAQVNLAERITNYQPNARNDTSVMRVIFINNGEVEFDSNPMYGPPPGAGMLA